MYPRIQVTAAWVEIRKLCFLHAQSCFHTYRSPSQSSHHCIALWKVVATAGINEHSPYVV